MGLRLQVQGDLLYGGSSATSAVVAMSGLGLGST